MHRATPFMLVVLSLAVIGCGADNEAYLTEARLERGLVIVLPGIEGVSEMNLNIRRGLEAGGVYCALPIYSWGRPIPGVGMLLNQTDFIGNRIQGGKIAKMVTQYQDNYPGRAVYIVGHSGGGGVAVFAAESMPDDRQVDGLVLLSASINSKYDLTKALKHCRNGIVNFYNEDDTALLGVGTTVVGNVDGSRGPSAGLVGFQRTTGADSADKQLAYSKLYNVRVTNSDGDPHASTTHAWFVSYNVAPWVLASQWPAGPSVVTVGLPAENSTSPNAKALAIRGR